MLEKRVLFIINGLGLGNSTRCSAVIHELFVAGCKIDVVSSANGFSYFKNSAEIGELFSFQALLYGKANGKLSIIKTLLNLPKLSLLFIKNCIFLHSLLKKKEYAAVVFDSDYSVASLFWLSRRPLLIAINNARIVIEECKKLRALPRNILLQYWVEKLDNLFHLLIPDIVICPIFKKNENTAHSRIKYTTPIIRSGLTAGNRKKEVQNILIMLSGSQFGSDISFLKKLPELSGVEINVIGKDGESGGKIRFFGKVYDNRNLIKAADMLVINAGFSAISEAIVLKKPAVVIPIENHAEQLINSLLFEKYGLGLLATQENAHEKISELLESFEKFSEAHLKFNSTADGAPAAAEFVVEAIWENAAQS